MLLEKELVVRNEQAGLNGEAKVRLQRDQERQRQRVAEMGRTIDFLRSDVRRLDEERIELRETYRKDMQRLTAERDAYMDEVDRMAFIMTERNATSEEVLSRAKGEDDGARPLGPARHLDRKDIPSSRPRSVRGYILPSISCRVIAID